MALKRKPNRVSRGAVVAGVTAVTWTLHAAEPSGTNALSGQMLLSDPLGRLVEVSTNAVPAALLPPATLVTEARNVTHSK